MILPSRPLVYSAPRVLASPVTCARVALERLARAGALDVPDDQAAVLARGDRPPPVGAEGRPVDSRRCGVPSRA